MRSAPSLLQDEVVLFLRGDASHPRDGFSFRAVEMLRQVGVRFATVDVDVDEAVARAVTEYSGWPDFPQLFVHREFIGGIEYLEQMHESGALALRLRDLPRASR